jgi:hypothetical protein
VTNTFAKFSRSSLLSLLLFVSLSQAWAAPSRGSRVCWDNDTDSALSVNNDEVLEWKRKTKAQYKDRALVKGTVVREIRSRSTHEHFEIRIGQGRTDVLEVVYNREFGELPAIQPGMQVEACGDYITVKNSPSGAIIHWVHYNPGDRDGGKHEHGYVVLDGVQYGHTEQKTELPYGALNSADTGPS